MWSCNATNDRGYLEAEELCATDKPDIKKMIGHSRAVIQGVITHVARGAQNSIVTWQTGSDKCLIIVRLTMPHKKTTYWGFDSDMVGLNKSMALRDMDKVKRVALPNGNINIHFGSDYAIK